MIKIKILSRLITESKDQAKECYNPLYAFNLSVQSRIGFFYSVVYKYVDMAIFLETYDLDMRTYRQFFKNLRPL